MVQECSECSLCSHIYVLPPPNGRESIGVCKLCGMTKTHFNHEDEVGWMTRDKYVQKRKYRMDESRLLMWEQGEEKERK
jgi:rubredoxin